MLKAIVGFFAVIGLWLLLGSVSALHQPLVYVAGHMITWFWALFGASTALVVYVLAR